MWIITIVPIILITLLILYVPTSPPALKNISSYTNLPDLATVTNLHTQLVAQDANLSGSIAAINVSINNMLIEIDTLRAKIKIVSSSQ